MTAAVQDDVRVAQGLAFELRRATPQDREALAAMYLSFEPKGESLGLPPRKDPQRWLDSLAGYPNFVAVAEGRLVGHSVLCTGGPSAEIAVFVHQDCRGRGLGKRLLRAMIDEARRENVQRVWGVTELDNIPMLRLAHSLGFVSEKDPRQFHLELRPSAEPDPHTAT